MLCMDLLGVLLFTGVLVLLLSWNGLRIVILRFKFLVVGVACRVF